MTQQSPFHYKKTVSFLKYIYYNEYIVVKKIENLPGKNIHWKI